MKNKDSLDKLSLKAAERYKRTDLRRTVTPEQVEEMKQNAEDMYLTQYQTISDEDELANIKDRDDIRKKKIKAASNAINQQYSIVFKQLSKQDAKDTSELRRKNRERD